MCYCTGITKYLIITLLLCSVWISKLIALILQHDYIMSLDHILWRNVIVELILSLIYLMILIAVFAREYLYVKDRECVTDLPEQFFRNEQGVLYSSGFLVLLLTLYFSGASMHI